MTHSFKEHALLKTLSVDETLCKNTELIIEDSETGHVENYFLDPKELTDLIGILLHIQAKKRKAYNLKL